MPQRRTLPFCAEYESCTCCDPRQAQGILRRIISGLRDPSLSLNCRDATARMACRPCDPAVGTNLRSAVCLGACNDWYISCKNDFFEQSQLDGQIRPCSEEAIVCSQLSEIAQDGSDLCKAHGLAVAQDDHDCWNGQPSKADHASCHRSHSSRRHEGRPFTSLYVTTAGIGLFSALAAVFCWRRFRGAFAARHQYGSDSLSEQPLQSVSHGRAHHRQQAVNLSHSRLAA